MKADDFWTLLEDLKTRTGAVGVAIIIDYEDRRIQYSIGMEDEIKGKDEEE